MIGSLSRQLRPTRSAWATAAGASRSLSRTSRKKNTLVLIRHGESVWNKENKFTGWYDVPLSEKGVQEAMLGGKLLKELGVEFHVAYSSYLKRAIKTLNIVLEEIDLMWIPVKRTWRLNERHYGALTGLNKQDAIKAHGKDQVKIWRRSFDIPPPALDEANPHWPGHDKRYKSLKAEEIPKTESLKLTSDRFIVEWERSIKKDLEAGKNVLVAAHGNSIRALLMNLEGISKEDITELNIPTGVPLVYELDENLKSIPHADAIHPLSGRYLGDQAAVREKILGVANQTK